MSSKSLDKNRVISSLFWKLLERGGTQGVQFIIQLILARLLLPEDFGVIAIVSVFIMLAEVFVTNGLNTALIQKKTVDSLDYSSVFYMNLVVSFLLYILIFIFSPAIAKFFRMSELVNITRVLGIVLIFDAIHSIQYAVMAKGMEFKKMFFGTFVATLIAGVFSLMFALTGLGVWTLVFQQIFSKLLMVVIFYFLVDWKPKFEFSFIRVKNLFSFGSKVLGSTLLDTLFNDLRSLVIGRLYPPAALGFYNRGKQFPSVIVSNLNGSIQSVMLPTLSSQQDNISKFKKILRRTIITSSFIIFPIMIGLIIIAEPLIRILLTETWIESVVFVQIFALTYSLRPIQTANSQSIIALGRSDILLKIQTIKNIVGLLILVISMYYGVYGIAVGTFVLSLVTTLLNIYPNKILLKYSYSEQLRDVLPPLFLSISMGVVIYIVKFFIFNDLLLLITQVILGIISYIVLSKIFKVEAFEYLEGIVTPFFKKEVLPE